MTTPTPGPFDVGDVIEVPAEFRNLAGTLIDPTLVTCDVTNPAGITVGYTVVHDSTGVYHALIQATLSGTHYYKFTGTGALAAVEEGDFFVRVSRVS